jgi:putative ABC transport system permease protein
MSDSVYALRQLIRRPSHTVAVVLCLAAGLTVSIAAFSILTSLMFGDLPGIPNRKTLVRAFLSYDMANGDHAYGISPDDFETVRDAGPALGSLAVEGDIGMAATGRHGDIGVDGAFVSGNYFQILRTVPGAGRLLTESDERSDAPPVVIVSEHFWRAQLDAAPDAIGSSMLIAGRSFTVVGVAPARFHGIHEIDLGDDDSHGLQLWIPLQHARGWPGAAPSSDPWLIGIGRLRDGATAAQAELQLGPRVKQLPHSNPKMLIRTQGLGSSPLLEILATLTAMLSVPLTVLGIACANVANLQLARASERSRELAVRLSLGARRVQLIRLLTIETAALAAMALVVAGISTFAIVRVAAPYFPVQLSVDWNAVAFSLILAVGVTIATGLAPAWQVMRGFDAGRLKQTAIAGSGHSRLRSTLVVAQVTLSLVMLSAGAVFLRSVDATKLESPEALRSHVVVQFDPSQIAASTTEATRFAESLQARLGADPRVKAVSLSRRSSIWYRASQTAGSTEHSAGLVEMTPSLLSVMHLTVLTGRPLNDSDRVSGNAVLVSAWLAEILAPGGSPLGQVLDTGEATSQRQFQIVGVVPDIPTYPMRAGVRPSPVVYAALPLELTTPFDVRVASDDLDAVSIDIRAIARDLNPGLPWLAIHRGDDSYLADARELQLTALVVSALGVIALALSATGLYAVMGYVVQLRRREIGVRMAIGAEPRQILRMVLWQALTLVVIGGVIGLGLAIPLAFILRSIVVATIAPLDPVAFGPAFLLLLLVGLLASALPARRATKIDPIAEIRAE